MARPIWNGIISFGLLNIPVSLLAAERRVDLHFRMIDSRTNKPIRYERVNADTGDEVPWKDIVQAFEYEKGNYVVLSEQELAKAAPAGKDTIEIEAFVDREQITAPYFEKPYYLLPGKKAEKGYVLLREILTQKRRAGIAYVIIRTRRYLCAVLPIGDMLVLNLLRFQQELVPADQFELPAADMEALRISKRELDMAGQLIDSMSADWTPENYIDDYRNRLSDIVEERLKSGRGLIQEQPGDEHEVEHAATNVVDFMALLRRSLDSGQRQPKAAAKLPKSKAQSKLKPKTARGKSSPVKTARRKAAATRQQRSEKS